MKARAKTQIALYGSTPNYAFQFDDLGFDGVGSRLHQLMREGDLNALQATREPAALGRNCKSRSRGLSHQPDRHARVTIHKITRNPFDGADNLDPLPAFHYLSPEDLQLHFGKSHPQTTMYTKAEG